MITMGIAENLLLYQRNKTFLSVFYRKAFIENNNNNQLQGGKRHSAQYFKRTAVKPLRRLSVLTSCEKQFLSQTEPG